MADFSGWSEFPVTGANARTAAGAIVGTDRSPAELHLGTLIHALKVDRGDRIGQVEGDQDGARLQEGFIFETAVEYMEAGLGFDEAVELAFKRYMLQLREGVVQQVRLERDGIHMTPDADYLALKLLESYKVTRRTLRNARKWEDFEEHSWAWVMTEKAYLYARGYDTVRWVVWWVAGDYSKGKGTGPQVLQATARFSQEELEENWRTVLAVRDRLKRERRA